jgi:hypothetical protein
MVSRSMSGIDSTSIGSFGFGHGTRLLVGPVGVSRATTVLGTA